MKTTVITPKNLGQKDATLCAASLLSLTEDPKITGQEARRIVIASLKLIRPLAEKHWWAYGVRELLTDALRAYAHGSSHMGDFWETIAYAAEKTEEAYKKYD